MGFFTRNTKVASNTATVQEPTVDTTIHYKDLTNEELEAVINNNISLARDTDPNLEVVELTRDNPTDSELLDFIIDEIRTSDATDDTIKMVVKTAVKKYNARIESEEKEKQMAEEKKAEETTAEETTTQNAAETQGQPKAAKEKGAWKKTAKKVAKIAIPVVGGIAIGVIGTELAIKKPWAKSKKSSSAPRPAAPKPAIPAKK